jgi:dolichol-phosphate mannosyltransferase
VLERRRARTAESEVVPEFDVTVVVPTRNERDNIAPLLMRLERVRPELRVEVLFVDDSSDDTPSVIEMHAKRSSRVVSVLHRPASERVGGLGGAVRLGLSAAKSDLVCVMDADLQHPPDLVGALLDEAHRSGSDVVVASRYCDRGDVGNFSALRVALSRGSAMLAKALFPRRLRAVSDPMSGFFLLRRSAVNVAELQPRGFKILLEILLGGRSLTISEVPFRFGERHSGDSKASLREGTRYIRRLLELRVSGRSARLAGFALVGAFGVLVNTVALTFLTRELHLWYLAASVLATQIAIVVNYALAERYVFRGVKTSRSPSLRLASYVLINNVSLLISGPVLWLLVSGFGMALVFANVLSLVALAVLRFAIADAYVWGSRSIRLPRLALAEGAR